MILITNCKYTWYTIFNTQRYTILLVHHHSKHSSIPLHLLTQPRIFFSSFPSQLFEDINQSSTYEFFFVIESHLRSNYLWYNMTYIENVRKMSTPKTFEKPLKPLKNLFEVFQRFLAKWGVMLKFEEDDMKNLSKKNNWVRCWAGLFGFINNQRQFNRCWTAQQH